MQRPPAPLSRSVACRAQSAGSLSRSRVLDRDDPEYLKELRRPAVIKEDLYQMDRRKRVKEVLGHREFCDQLETLIQNDFEVKSDDSEFAQMHQTLSGLHNIGYNRKIFPIADLAKTDKYSAVERNLRNKLASLYRLVDLFQWSQGIYNHITLRLPSTSNDEADIEILINPFGLLYNEITASSLVKIGLDGKILDNGSTELGVNQAGYVLHSAIHSARPDVKCVVHLHTAVVAAVSSMKCGLLPICQEAMIVGVPAYHDYQGIVSAEEERESLVADLGDKNIMILRNHGFVACGESIEDALHLSYHMIIACETQVRAMKTGIDDLIIPSPEAVEKAYKTARSGGGGVNRTNDQITSRKWRIGELEWEAWMRRLDSAGFRTGHIYRNPRLNFPFHSPSVAQLTEIAIPPAASGRSHSADHARSRRNIERVNWLTSPNTYQRIQLYETNTTDPKPITKWINDLTKSQETLVKISSPHQFCSVNGDPKEFKEKQRQLKDDRVAGHITSGPTSQVFNGPVNAEPVKVNEPVNHMVMIRTVSKGVIDRKHQHNAAVIQQLYAPNPFLNETDEKIQQYFKEVTQNTRSASMTPSVMGKSEIVCSNGTPNESPLYRSKSFEFDTVSLMQAVQYNYRQNSEASTRGELNRITHLNTETLPNSETKQRRGLKKLFSFGRRKNKVK